MGNFGDKPTDLGVISLHKLAIVGAHLGAETTR